ncbi:MAG TPA: thioesterase family protein [Acidimicrobiia bacterium]
MATDHDSELDSDLDFDRETAVEPRGGGRYRAALERSWWVMRGPNGGYLAAIALRALAAAVGDAERAPRSLTVHYAAPPTDGALDVTTRIEREGRSLTSCSARLEQRGRLIGMALGAFSRARSGPDICDLVMPEVAPPEAVDARALPPDVPPIALRWESRPVLGAPVIGGAAPADEAVTGSWIRLPEGHVVDAAVAAAITDAAIPAIFSRVDQAFVVPTVDLTIHFRSALPVRGARPDDFVLAVFRTGVVAEGFLEEDGEVWTADGTLIAQSRQLAAVMPLA